jgi:uncharacterized protein YbjQ (UPF0145 family)
MLEQVTITKVVSRNFIQDFIAKFQNMVGLNLTSYEAMVQKGVEQIKQELGKRNIKVKWFRYEISELSNGAIAIMYYGEVEE